MGPINLKFGLPYNICLISNRSNIKMALLYIKCPVIAVCLFYVNFWDIMGFMGSTNLFFVLKKSMSSHWICWIQDLTKLLAMIECQKFDFCNPLPPVAHCVCFTMNILGFFFEKIDKNQFCSRETSKNASNLLKLGLSS